MDSITKQMWNLVGSHDTKRIYDECEGNIDRIKLAIAYQFLYLGVPYIYYGDEVGLDGGDDPQNRKCMIWDEEKQNKELLNFYKKMIKIRASNKALVHGDFEEVYCDENLLAFKRVLNDEKLIVIFNNSDEDAIIELNLKCSAKELITGNIQELKKINLDKRSFKVFKY